MMFEHHIENIGTPHTKSSPCDVFNWKINYNIRFKWNFAKRFRNDSYTKISYPASLFWFSCPSSAKRVRWARELVRWFVWQLLIGFDVSDASGRRWIKWKRWGGKSSIKLLLLFSFNLIFDLSFCYKLFVQVNCWWMII